MASSGLTENLNGLFSARRMVVTPRRSSLLKWDRAIMVAVRPAVTCSQQGAGVAQEGRRDP